MDRMKAYILYLGNMYSDSNYSVMGDTAASPAEPNASHRLMHTPSTAVLIQHPSAGWILYDTGMPADPASAWPETIKNGCKYDVPDGCSMEEQLKSVGLSPKDISYIITSHMHMDHIGNDKLFAETAEFFQSSADAAVACQNVLNSPDSADHGWYIHDEVLLPRKKIHYIEEDCELFPGIDILTLPGHTPCVLGIVLHLEGCTMICTSDAVNEHRNYEGRLPGGIYDSVGYRKSLRKLHELEKKYTNIVFLFGHDITQLNSLKKAPEYYS